MQPPFVPLPVMSAQLAPGQIVAGGKYRLLDVIGRGGFGVVYRAEQRALGREVALKVLLPTARDVEKALLRFRREAELAQRLEHPNTVRIYDFGQLETDHWYIALELLRGKSLDQEIARAPFTTARTARVAIQILKSLMEAHAHGVVHRDLKPQNIFLCEFTGEQDFVKVLDFGVAKVQEDEGRAVTHDGQVVGTPAYMAPEQVLGAPVGPSSDIYSLGLVLAECLLGWPVIGNLPPIQACMMQSSPAPLDLPESVRSTSLGPVISRAIQKNPAARYHNAGDMLRDVESVLSLASSETALATMHLPRGLPATPPPPAMRTMPFASTSPPQTPQVGSITTTSGLAQVTRGQTPAPPASAVTMSRGAFIAIIAVCALLLVGSAVGGTLLYVRSSASSPPVATTVVNSTTARGALAHFDVDAAGHRFEKLGYTIYKNPPFESTGYHLDSFTGASAKGESLVLQYTRTDSEVMTQMMVDSYKASPTAFVVRDGTSFVMLAGRTQEDSRRLAKIAIGP